MIQHLLIDRENCLSVRSSVRQTGNVWSQDYPITGTVHINDLRQIMRLNEKRLVREIGTDIIDSEEKEPS